MNLYINYFDIYLFTALLSIIIIPYYVLHTQVTIHTDMYLTVITKTKIKDDQKLY